MKANFLVGALVAAGVIGTGAAAYRGHWSPIASVQATTPVATLATGVSTPAVMAAGVAAPAANPTTSSLPLNGFTDLVKQYGPAVVNVNVEGTVKTSAQDGPGMDDVPPEFRDFFRGFRGQMPRATPMRGLGSGFIVSPDGYILTNAHVVENASHVTVRLTDRREYTAKVIGSDKQSDVAVIKIDATGLPTVKLGDSRRAQVGEWVVAIGSPFGFENSVSAGIVSAKSRSLPDATYVPFIQTDVAVNPGNSGGPLFNLAGEVIGINSQIYSRSGGFQGISFAIPIEVALNVKDQIVKTGKVTRGRLGVTVQEVNASLASSFGLDRPRGALVASVDDGSPAQKAGLQQGDIILSYNGQPIERSNDLPLLVADSHPGTKADVEVWRKGRKETLQVVSTVQKERVASNDDENGSPSTRGRLGVVVRPLTAEERSEIGGKKALVVEEVSGAAERAGVQPGDLVLQLNGTAVNTPEQLRDAVSKSGKRAALLIQRENRQLFVPVELG
jgi:serine protease Do